MLYAKPFHLLVGKADNLMVEDFELQGLLGCVFPQFGDLQHKGCDDGHHAKCRCRPRQVLPPPAVNVGQQFVHLLIAEGGRSEASPHYFSPFSLAQIHLFEDDTQRVDVIAHVGHGQLCLFGCHVFHGAGRLFQHGMAVGVGQSEVYDLHVVTVMGDHDVGGFQVTVHHLLRMDIGYGLCQFDGYAPSLADGGRLREVFVEGPPVYPFHDQAHGLSSFRQIHLLKPHCLHHMGMCQSNPDFKLLAEHLLVERLRSLFGLQTFQQKPSAVSLRFVEVATAIRRQGIDFREISAHTLVFRGDESGIVVVDSHGSEKFWMFCLDYGFYPN